MARFLHHLSWTREPDHVVRRWMAGVVPESAFLVTILGLSRMIHLCEGFGKLGLLERNELRTVVVVGA